MFWRLMDERHPAYNKLLAGIYGDTIHGFYMKMDEVLGLVLDNVEKNTAIVVVSDHGFSPFYKYFHLNGWLKKRGYLSTLDDKGGEFLSSVDWTKTIAYGFGLNGLYLNLIGREGLGIVPEHKRDEILIELKEKLLAVTDPDTGERIISNVYVSDEVFDGNELRLAPDLIIGYNRGYRVSWQSAIGAVPGGSVVGENKKSWSSDHCVDKIWVPGVLISNLKIKVDDPSLKDIAPSVLSFFGMNKPEGMDGRAIF
jgi:predicted AlkP superfamily phosphohydrolase/phosphomutase